MHRSESMPDPHHERADLREFLAALERPTSEFRRNGMDIKPREIEIVKREIAAVTTMI